MASYSEKVVATVELNLSDFEAKMKAADLAVQALASKKNIKYDRTSSSFSNAGQNMISAAMKEMSEFADRVMEDADYEVPKDTEVLRESARVLPPVKVGRRIRIDMGFGYGDAINPNTHRTAEQYALPVHEIYDAKHSPPTKSHYLIDPLLSRARTYGADLGIAMKQANEGLFRTYKVAGRSISEDVGFSSETDVPALGGGTAFRGGDPLNPGRFSKRPK